MVKKTCVTYSRKIYTQIVKDFIRQQMYRGKSHEKVRSIEGGERRRRKRSRRRMRRRRRSRKEGGEGGGGGGGGEEEEGEEEG